MEENLVRYESLEEGEKDSLNKEFFEKYPKYVGLAKKKKSIFKRMIPLFLITTVLIITAIILAVIGSLSLRSGDASSFDFILYYVTPFLYAGALMFFITFFVFMHKLRLRTKREIDFSIFLKEKGITYQPKGLMRNSFEMMNAIKNQSRNK